MASIADMVPDCRSGLPAAPDILIQNAIARAAHELCRQSQVWKVQLDDQAAQANTQQYDIGAPSGSYAEKIVWAKYNGNLMDPMREDELLAQSSASTGPPSYYSLSLSGQVLSVWPVPRTTDTGAITVYAVLVPLDTATTLPDDLVNQYRAGFIALARADMMTRSPGMPWHNPKEAMSQQFIGEDWILRAKRKQHSGGHVPLRVRPVSFS